jgi:hypothetical protein
LLQLLDLDLLLGEILLEVLHRHGPKRGLFDSRLLHALFPSGPASSVSVVEHIEDEQDPR